MSQPEGIPWRLSLVFIRFFPEMPPPHPLLSIFTSSHSSLPSCALNMGKICSFPVLQKHHYARFRPSCPEHNAQSLTAAMPCFWVSVCETRCPYSIQYSTREMDAILHNQQLPLYSFLTHILLPSYETKKIFSSLHRASFLDLGTLDICSWIILH